MNDFLYKDLLNAAKKLRGTIMCGKLNDLCGKSAEQLLELYGSNEKPVQIEKILKKMNIEYFPMDFSNVESMIPEVVEAKGRILGAATIINNDICIAYDKNGSDNRTRFTLAHEIAHCCLNASSFNSKGHLEFRMDGSSDSPEEIAANIFAGKLLIPEKMLLEFYKTLVAPLSDVLAREFKVSVAVMEARLKFLGLPFYSPNYVEEDL